MTTNAALYSNMRPTFEMGKEEAEARAQMVRAANELIALAKKMDEERNKNQR